jgi:AcrR family transcriptional regulator
MAAPKKIRAHLTEDRIVDTALDIMRDDPRGTFTLAKLAQRLGVQTPSIYSHVPSKQHIIERVRSRVVSMIDCSAFATKEWDVALAEWARSYAAAFVQHPETIPLLATSPVQAPELISQYEVVAKALLAAGWPRSEIIPTFTVVESFVLGSVLDLIAPVEMVQPTEGNYPVLESLLGRDSFDEARARRTFEFGLETLMTGFRAHLDVVRSEDGDPALVD